MKATVRIDGFQQSLELCISLDTIALQMSFMESMCAILSEVENRFQMDAEINPDSKDFILQRITRKRAELVELKRTAHKAQSDLERAGRAKVRKLPLFEVNSEKVDQAPVSTQEPDQAASQLSMIQETKRGSELEKSSSRFAQEQKYTDLAEVRSRSWSVTSAMTRVIRVCRPKQVQADEPTPSRSPQKVQPDEPSPSRSPQKIRTLPSLPTNGCSSPMSSNSTPPSFSHLM